MEPPILIGCMSRYFTGHLWHILTFSVDFWPHFQQVTFVLTNLTGHLAVLTRKCPVSGCYHKPCNIMWTPLVREHFVNAIEMMWTPWYQDTPSNPFFSFGCILTYSGLPLIRPPLGPVKVSWLERVASFQGSRLGGVRCSFVRRRSP